jgi:hypothetical protein
MLLLLLLLEGAHAITPLPTNRTKNRGAQKSETKYENDISWNRLGFKTFSFSLSRAHKDIGRALKESRKKKKNKNIELQRHSSRAICSIISCNVAKFTGVL